MKESNSTGKGIDVQQHTTARSVALHLLPGLLFLPVFMIAEDFTAGLDLPEHLTPSLIGFVLVIIPFQMGYLLYQAKKLNGKLSLQGIILYRESMPWWQYIILGLPMLLWAAFVFVVVAPPVDSFLIERFFYWMPQSFFLNTLFDSLSQHSEATLLVTGIVFVAVVGFVGPVVEELYFRGYLLPRIALRGGWAPTVHILLFSLYHFWSPWQNVVRILAMSPLYFAVWRKRNIYLGMIWHIVANVLNALALMRAILGAA